jgi:Sulfotransferase family
VTGPTGSPTVPDPQFEEAVRLLNESLAPVADASYVADLPDRLPPLHVIGVPRSGTTLAIQLVTSHLTVRRIDRLAAAFWKAPAIGLRLSTGLLGDIRASSYESRHGATFAVTEPHEFGAFWRELLGYEAMDEDPARTVDWPRVRLVLTNMLAVAGEPIAFKSFLVAWHMAEMTRTLPNSCYLWMRRDPLDTAVSLAGLRGGQAGSLDAWVSMRPAAAAELSGEPWWVQVAAQVYHVDKAIEAGAAAVVDAVISVDYEALCAHPAEALSRVAGLLNANGAEVHAVGDPPRRFDVSTPELSDEDHRADLVAALRSFYG